MHPLVERMQAPGPKKILACDGGGILGLMSVEILAALEYQLRVSMGKGADFVLADYFDFVCGTSTGAIIATCIASGMSMDKIRQFYLDSGKQMFDKAALANRLKYNYNDEPLAKLLHQAFDEQLAEKEATLGSEKLRCLLMMVMRNHTTDSPWPVWNNPFAKYNDRNRKDCNLKLPLWQLVRASTAAPTYFPPEVVSFAPGTPEEYSFMFVDGGVTTYNNPAWLALQMATAKPYAVNWQTGVDQLLLVSVGTGSAAKLLPKNTSKDAMNILHFAQSIPSALMNAASAGWDMTCRMLGECRHGAPIDSEFGAMLAVPGEANWTGPKLFTYLRYDPDVSQKGLLALGLNDVDAASVQLMDSVDHLNEIRKVGLSYAQQHCKYEHFKGFVS